MAFSTFSRATVLLLTLFTSTALSQGPENRGYGVIDPSLTGTRPGYRTDQVSYWAPNDDSYVNTAHFQQQMVDIHNRYRAQHGSAPLKWDTQLAASSQKHVDTCVYAHSAEALAPATTYGENIYFGYESVASGVGVWGDEGLAYQSRGFYTNGKAPDHDLLHFTQMVWKATTTIGCARKKCVADQFGGDNVQESWFVCCHYYRRGNYLGQYQANVLPPR